MFEDKQNILLRVNDSCYLRVLTTDDVSDDYVFWMNDYEVTKYTEQNYRKHTRSDVEEFVNQKFNSKSDLLFGIYFEEKHIGNIKLGPIKWEHKSAEVSFFIGNKDFWGKGIASAVVGRVVDFSIKDMGLEKINAGYYDGHIGSAKVLEKCGFKLEGERRSTVIFEGARINSILVGYLKDDGN